MSWVIDASIALAWCFEDERDESSDALLDRATSDPIDVPDLWVAEVANVLALAVRRGRLRRQDAARFTELLRALPIASHPPASIDALVTIAHETGLTAYDATYLELAARLGAPLATRDDRLARAARARGVALI
ncbi:MAG: type II toxin-antitoxin system VapC family toxin [Deltaproteobacteria bacterium]|nr:type II toxin-antitoxin system VapC family toxin [Deltaproteobacteria bacterium]